MSSLRVSGTERDELKTSQRGAFIVVCQLENAQWAPHRILMEAQKKIALIKLHMEFIHLIYHTNTHLMLLRFIVPDMAKGSLLQKITLSMTFLPDMFLFFQHRKKDAGVMLIGVYPAK